jgi:DnaJ family protein C protein 2
MSPSGLTVVPIAKLDWPETLPTGRVQCGTESYLAYRARREKKIPFLHYSSFSRALSEESSSSCADIKDVINSKTKRKAAVDLNEITAEELEELSYYEVLGGIKMHSTPEQIKRAFHKASLKYHPDKQEANKETKEGSGDDPVFLKVKEAFETLSDATKRKAYDSMIDFDDSIPAASDIKNEKDFYEMFGDCFERNLRFAAENDPDQAAAAEARKKKAKQKRGKGKGKEKTGPPSLGNAKTSISEVHDFYDYWVGFESWRDYTLAATKLTEHDTDLAGDRYEKRWMEKEIGRKAKSLKKDEVARITKMVERAMALDPRLKREKVRLDKEKKEKARLKKEKRDKEEREAKEKEELAAKLIAEREEQEKQEKAEIKAKREKEKKKLRKSRQVFRRLIISEHEADSSGAWTSVEDMNDDIEIICEKLDAIELDNFTGILADDSNKNKLNIVIEKANGLRDDTAKAEKAKRRERDQLRIAAKEKEMATKAASAPKEWSKEEISALAKGVKKYPAGGANRWGTIATFVNNLCKLPEPRRKEECIEKYNQIANSSSIGQTVSQTKKAAKAPAAEWTDEENKLLQEGLAKFPASMDKNERWSSIAKGVPGKTKKECVARFKAIREALKKSKQ